MPTPSERKTVQARILEYAEGIGWTMGSREEAERRRGFDPDAPLKERAKGRSLYFDGVLDAKVLEFNPRYDEAVGALPGRFRNFHANIDGNRDFAAHLRNRGKFFDVDAKRDLIDYSDKVEGICCNQRTPSQLVSVKDHA